MPTAITFGSIAARAFGFLGRVLRKDEYFKYVTLLLPGNGTNGAQNNTFLDSSTNNFTITRNGNTTQGTFSPYGSLWSNYFDGSGDYLTFPNNSAFAFGTGAFTIEFWVNSNGLNDSFILSGRAGIGTMHITYGGFGGSTAGSLRYVGSSTITSGSVLISNGQWNHCAIVRGGSNNITLYVNGVSVGTGTDSTNYTATTGTWYINSNDSGPTPGGAGYISNLRIIKGTAVYTAAFTPPASPLTAITNTSLLTCQSNRFIDNSTNAFAITRNGDVSVQRFSPFNPTAPYAAGTDGGSGYFDGSGDYLSVVDNAAFTLGSGDWTIEAWVFTGTSATQKVVAGQIDSGGNVSSLSFQLDMSSTDYPRIIIASGTTTYIATSSSTLPKNQWVHLAGVRDGNTMRIYVNGVQTGTQSVTGVTVNDSSSNVGIGRHGEYAGLDWNGYISNFRLVKGTCVYPSGTTFTPPTAPLTAITNTSLLTNFTNGGIIDNAMMNDLETVGNAQISTAQSKFGGASMYFDGTGDFLYGAPSESYQLGTGDFTIEFWINASASGSYNQVVGTYNVNHDAGAWRVGNRFNSANQVYFARGTGSGVNEFTANVNVNDGIWHHVAVVRSSGTVTIYVDGTASASSTITGTCSSSNQLRVGYNPRDNSYLTGYIDDLRITKGYARYTSSFTAPTAPFPLQ